MKEPVPSEVVELVVGLDDNYSFMDFLDPENPTRLSLNLEQRCELVFTLRDQLILAGWSFQKQPIEFLNDYGINFSSYVWIPHSCQGKIAPRSRFKVIFECERMGVFHYSLFMRDGLGQNIDLDPDIENGAGRVPLIPVPLFDKDQVAALIRRGEILAAYDIAHAALEAGEMSRDIAYAAVLCLARAGAVDFARAEYIRLGLDQADDHPDAIALGGRLLKDVALAASGRRHRLRQGVDAPLSDPVPALRRALRRDQRRDHDPGGRRRRRRGEQALAALAIAPPAGLTGEAAYYESASRAEALFLTGDRDAARATLAGALAFAPHAYAAHASTLRQLDMLCRLTGVDAAWLAPFRPPVCAHFTGHIIDPRGPGALSSTTDCDLRERIDRLLTQQRVGFGYGGLAAGADIVFAEALLASGAELHVVLPVNCASFVAVSVAPFGENWVERFDRCMTNATSVRYASQDPYLGDEQVFAYSSQFAMGCAVLRAQTLSTEAIQLAVWDGHPTDGPSGVAADLAYWARSGRRRAVIDIERPPPALWRPAPSAETGRRAMKAMLFADVKGFGALRDDQIPAFVETVMGQMARAIEGLDATPLHVETWGDGLFLVFDQPIDAALAALALLETHKTLDLRAVDLPRGLDLRISGHYGPVHLRTNPLTKAPAVIGAHVVVAARIEPDVAPGSACVSEALAGALATFHGDRVRCGYVGRTQERKGFAATPIFSLTRAS